jgi:RNA polymerase sigma factor for flagellar operon FliA
MITQTLDHELNDQPGLLASLRATPAADAPPTIDDGGTASREHFEQLFVRSLPLIRQAISVVVRRYHVSADHAEEFAAIVRLRIIERDYAILRKFRGRSSLRTFLTVVVQRMFLDYRTAQWGKWRPTAKSRRHGPVVVLLERLTRRDGLSFDQAWSALEATHREPLDRRHLEAIHAALPRRSRPRFVSDEDLDLLPAAGGVADGRLVEIENTALVARAGSLLAGAIASLDPQDRQIVLLRFCEGLPVAAIARELGLDQRALYRRLERLMRALRTQLETRGVCGPDVLEALDASNGAGIELHYTSGAALEARPPGVPDDRAVA